MQRSTMEIIKPPQCRKSKITSQGQPEEESRIRGLLLIASNDTIATQKDKVEYYIYVNLSQSD
jgi:hypothetical protein